MSYTYKYPRPAVTADCIAQITKKKLSKDLNLFKQTKGILKDNVEQRISYMAPVGSIPVYYVTTPKEDVLSGLENSLVEVVGSKEVLNKSLKQNGVEEIEAVGQVFDPGLHEAVGMVTDENLGEKIIKEEYRKGYKIGSKVIRHSMVIVAN